MQSDRPFAELKRPLNEEEQGRIHRLAEALIPIFVTDPRLILRFAPVLKPPEEPSALSLRTYAVQAAYALAEAMVMTGREYREHWENDESGTHAGH